MAQALQLATVPRCWVVPRRAYGVGLLATGPARPALDLVVAWPDAEVGYLGDGVGGELFRSTADAWSPDGVVDPEETREIVVRHLRAVLGPNPVAQGGVLATWPMSF